MRLAVFTSHFPGRVNTFFARDMRALIESGIDIDIFPLYPLDQDLWRYVPDILNDSVLPRDRVHHLSLGRTLRPSGLAGGRLARFLRDTCAIRASALAYGVSPVVKSEYVFLKAWTWAQEHRDAYDHVLAYWGNYSASCAYLFHRQMRRPVPFSMFLHAGTDLYRDQVFLKQKMLYADNIFVVCDFNREFIKSRYADVYPQLERKIHLYHLGLELGEFTFRPDGRKPRTVLAVGSLEKIKGFDCLIQAISHVARRGLDVELELIGDGPERAHLEQLAERLGISSRVAFRGLLTFDRVRAAMAEATILVHPSIGLGDAVPTVIKEAMALGTPIVASRVAGIPELLDDGRCGTLVTPKDIDLLAEAIEQLLVDPDLRRRHAAAGRQHAERQFDLWRNGSALAARLKSATRGSADCLLTEQAERAS